MFSNTLKFSVNICEVVLDFGIYPHPAPIASERPSQEGNFN